MSFAHGLRPEFRFPNGLYRDARHQAHQLENYIAMLPSDRGFFKKQKLQLFATSGELAFSLSVCPSL